MKKYLKFLWLIPVTAVLLGCLIFVTDCYHASAFALSALETTEDVTVTRDGRLTVFSPALPEAGFVFYPGGKVEADAYAPLMAALARKNILCVLVDMPLNLAFFDADAGEEIPEKFPDIDRWFIGGHSLGGTMAARCAQDASDYLGLVLLASYCDKDISQTDLDVLCVYGTEDQVLNMERYEQYRANLPQPVQEIQIRGGNHAFFGSYGLQEGDGLAAITAGEQLALTAAYLYTFFT